MIDSSRERKRLGIKTPRSTLLPPYMATNEYFTAFCDAMDSVYGSTADAGLEALSNIRNMWVQSVDTEKSVDLQQMVPNDAWSTPDRELVVRQVNQLGMKLQTAGIVTDDAFQTIARFVGIYWFGKGTEKFMEFMNYCLSSDFRVFNMWTEDYDQFFNEGDPEIGTPIWEGGTWYPTTHVTIEAKGGFKGIDIITLQAFFYEIANYNLVLKAIDANFDMYIVPDVEASKAVPIADIVAMALVNDYQVVLSNFKNRGAAPPPMHESEQLPSTYHAMGSVPADFNTAFLLAQPTGWMWLDDAQTMRVPVYGRTAQTITDQADIGVKLLGDPLPGNQFNLLYGPVEWIKIDGSPRSSSRIPAYSTGASTIIDGISVSARAVGMQRTFLLTNPAGFFQTQPGKFVPYWN